TRIYGWLGFRNKLGASAFTFEDEQLALMLGIQTAIAYENALRFQALEQAKRRTEFAMRAAEMGIWEIDSTSGRVTWSEPMPAVVGIPAEHMPTSVVELLELVHPDDRERMEAEIRKVLVDGTPLAIDARALTADGGVRWIAGRARAVVEDGQVRGLLGVAINIDERKHLEAQLRQAQKMDAIGQLAGGVAHDFNNLLTVIKGYAEFLRDESVDEAQKTDADEILVASDRAAALTRQLLMFSRQQRVERRIVDLNDQLEKVSKMLRRLVGERFTIDLDLAGDLAPVYADANQLDQVVMNLVVNARDAMLLGGAITIGAGPLAAAAGAFGAGPAEAGPFVHLWVRDTGSGMTDEVRARLFEPFFTTKSRGAGTGLGLATVHGIVVESGGYITVDSAPGAGTTIHVYLPAASGTSAAPPAPPARARVATGTVLLVEDEPAVRQVAERVLQGVGYDVFSVESADAARRVFETRRIDLLLTDVIMPGCSGPALYRELSKTCPGLRVMYMSGYTDDAITGNDIDDDTPLVRKPFAAEELAGKVQEAMGR
ncbi:MAG TPA: ATP-binding protein, partial [Vicinamibacterales bacterium]|nr:ATP-binding protein [Vicinamibacterales bacterium]